MADSPTANLFLQDHPTQEPGCLDELVQYAQRCAQDPRIGRYRTLRDLLQWIWDQPVVFDHGEQPACEACHPHQRDRVFSSDGMNCWEALGHVLGWLIRNGLPQKWQAVTVVDQTIGQGPDELRHVYPIVDDQDRGPQALLLQRPVSHLAGHVQDAQDQAQALYDADVAALQKAPRQVTGWRDNGEWLTDELTGLDVRDAGERFRTALDNAQARKDGGYGNVYLLVPGTQRWVELDELRAKLEAAQEAAQGFWDTLGQELSSLFGGAGGPPTLGPGGLSALTPGAWVSDSSENPPAVYQVDNDGLTLHHVANQQTAIALRGDNYDATVQRLSLAGYPRGTPISAVSAYEGKAVQQAQSSYVYLVQGGVLRWIPNWTVGARYGLGPSSVVQLPAGAFNNVTIGDALPAQGFVDDLEGGLIRVGRWGYDHPQVLGDAIDLGGGDGLGQIAVSVVQRGQRGPQGPSRARTFGQGAPIKRALDVVPDEDSGQADRPRPPGWRGAQDGLPLPDDLDSAEAAQGTGDLVHLGYWIDPPTPQDQPVWEQVDVPVDSVSGTVAQMRQRRAEDGGTITQIYRLDGSGTWVDVGSTDPAVKRALLQRKVQQQGRQPDTTQRRRAALTQNMRQARGGDDQQAGSNDRPAGSQDQADAKRQALKNKVQKQKADQDPDQTKNQDAAPGPQDLPQPPAVDDDQDAGTQDLPQPPTDKDSGAPVAPESTTLVPEGQDYVDPGLDDSTVYPQTQDEPEGDAPRDDEEEDQ